MDRQFDVFVLGAGMVGAASAAFLAERGLKVALIDRQAPGEGTSYGNAGVIDRSSLLPTAFPRHLPTLLRYLSGQTGHLHFNPGFLPRVAGWLYAYFRESAPERIAASAARLAPLAAFAAAEHKGLAARAGASELIRDTGWLHLYRTQGGFNAERSDHDLMREHGVTVDELDWPAISALEPHMKPVMVKAAFLSKASSTSDPGALAKAYAAYMQKLGGRFIVADVGGLVKRAQGFALACEEGAFTAPQVVVALGPWAKEFLKRFDIDVPIAIKRGYHMHYSAQGNAVLGRPTLDVEAGYNMTPMMKGIRITTGAEFDARDAPPTPVQLDRSERFARTLFPLDQRIEPEPWLGRRPNTPDSCPIIGPAPGIAGMWLAVGHGHWGIGLGAATGRLIADLVSGAQPFVDPAPLGLQRFCLRLERA